MRGLSWQPAVQREFRHIILTRLQRFVDRGFTGLAAHDEPPVDPATTFLGLFNRSPWLTRSWPRVAAYVRDYPRADLAGAEMLLYWMKTTFTPRPNVQAVQVVIIPKPDGEAGNVEVLVISRQVFATHYVDGSLSVSALLSDPADPSRHYLSYANRTSVDALGGWLTSLKRFFIERRVRSAARSLFATQRQRLQRVR